MSAFNTTPSEAVCYAVLGDKGTREMFDLVALRDHGGLSDALRKDNVMLTVNKIRVTGTT